MCTPGNSKGRFRDARQRAHVRIARECGGSINCIRCSGDRVRYILSLSGVENRGGAVPAVCNAHGCGTVRPILASTSMWRSRCRHHFAHGRRLVRQSGVGDGVHHGKHRSAVGLGAVVAPLPLQALAAHRVGEAVASSRARFDIGRTHIGPAHRRQRPVVKRRGLHEDAGRRSRRAKRAQALRCAASRGGSDAPRPTVARPSHAVPFRSGRGSPTSAAKSVRRAATGRSAEAPPSCR